MSEPLRFVPAEGLVVGWDFSTGSVKCLVFGMDGQTVAEVRLPTDLSNGDPANPAVSELNLMQLEGQARRASVRGIAAEFKAAGRLTTGLPAAFRRHITPPAVSTAITIRSAGPFAGTIKRWRVTSRGERRLGGAKRVRELVGGPWADRYTLSHLVKDEDPDLLF